MYIRVLCGRARLAVVSKAMHSDDVWSRNPGYWLQNSTIIRGGGRQGERRYRLEAATAMREEKAALNSTRHLITSFGFVFLMHCQQKPSQHIYPHKTPIIIILIMLEAWR